MLKILVDIDIPYIKGVFEPFAQVEYHKGSDITNDKVLDADALIVRTRTRCNEHLLKNSSVKLISTATIGTDHIDLEYCKINNIKVVNSAGCNAAAVMQHVFTALYALANKKGLELPNILNYNSDDKKILGVIGVGNVGSKVAALGEFLGFEVLRCDPIKEKEQTISFNRGEIKISEFKDFFSLDYVLENSDVITMHTWLDNTTRGMANNEFFNKIKNGAIFINASRGEVVDDESLMRNLNRFSGVILDVWNNEPNINQQLLKSVDIATPHIAGYSMEGKINGTVLSVRQTAQFFDLDELKDFSITPDEPNTNFISLDDKNICEIAATLENIFPIFEEDLKLKSNPQSFEQLRSNYKYRREFYVNPRTKTTNFK